MSGPSPTDGVLYEFLGAEGRDADERVQSMAQHLAARRADVRRLREALDKSMAERADLRRLLNESYEGVIS